MEANGMTFTHKETRNHHTERHDSEDRHLKVLIETMSRDGYTEREIVAAVKRAGGRRGDTET
jgi:hypothetical protein